jgi:hypothetical protein
MAAGEFTSAAIPNIVSFGLDQVAPPSPLYIQRDDQLEIQVNTCKPGGDTFTIIWRFLEASPDIPGQPGKPPDPSTFAPGGHITQTIKTARQDITIAQDTQIGVAIPLAEGYLLSITANTLNPTTRGISFARAFLVRPPASTFNISQMLFSDYITRSMSPGWPGGTLRSGSESTGNVLSVQVANPAAGADWTLVVPGFRRFSIQSFQATFTASAAVANRNISVIVDDGVNTVWTHDASAAVTAGQAVQVVATGTSAPVGVITTVLPIVLPPSLRIFAPMRVRVSTGNIQAGDQWSSIWFLVEQWLDI